MDFRSIYEHGFARVAACTGHAAIADPTASAEAVLRQARGCAQKGVAVAIFPELCLTGYSIEDLLLQDALLDEVGRAEDRRLLCCSASARCLAAYVYAAAGLGEPTTDLSWDGQTMIYENGVLLAETDRFPVDDHDAVADVDLGLLRQERQRIGTFDDNRRTHAARTGGFRQVPLLPDPPAADLGLLRHARAVPVRAGRSRPPRPGLLRGVHHPGRGGAAAAGGDRRPEGGHRGVRRPGLHRTR